MLLLVLDLLRVITYRCLAYVSVVIHHLLALSMFIPVNRVTLVIL